MPAIVTLTMNPALDLSTTTKRVEHTHKLRCGEGRYDPGGGGINVARVVNVLGGDVTAVFPAGGLIGQLLCSRLDAVKLRHNVIPIVGETRESFNVSELETGKQYRFILPGPDLSISEQAQCFDSIATLHPHPNYLVASGSLPPGAEALHFFAEIAKLAARIGCRLVLDTPLALRHVPRQCVFMMKPSARELAGMAGRALDNRAEQIEAARSIIREGYAEIIVVSLGADGALLVTDEAEEYFPATKVPVRSAVGAGDSMVGGIVLALERGWTINEAVRYGVAAGAAAIMNPGAELCHPEDVERLFKSK